MTAAKTPPLIDVAWQRSYRLVPSRFPPVGLFDRVATPAELEVVYAIEGLTNPRLRQEAGDISLVPPEDRVVGPGSTPVMAAFCHLNREGSRFSDGTWGVYYTAASLHTAVAEVAHHRQRFLRATKEPPIDIDMRAYVAKVEARLHDVRGAGWKSVHDPDSYAASQHLARRLRDAGAWGIVYRSVRDPGNDCVAAFRPRAVRLPVLQGPHLTLRWNGSDIEQWYEKSSLHDLPPA